MVLRGRNPPASLKLVAQEWFADLIYDPPGEKSSGLIEAAMP